MFVILGSAINRCSRQQTVAVTSGSKAKDDAINRA